MRDNVPTTATSAARSESYRRDPERFETDGISQRSGRLILGMRVDCTNYEDAASQVAAWAEEALSRYVCVATVNNVMEAYDCLGFRRVMNEADLVTPDGMPLVWGLRLLGCKSATRVYGPDLTPGILSVAERMSVPVGFYGSSPSTLNDLCRFVATNFPRLNVVYTYSPPFRPLTPFEDQQVVGKIARSGVRILFVGLNTPKQDYWMAAHRGRVQAVMIGVGAAFDFLAGTKRQAPRWMMSLGLEWLFRFACEPRRLWKRYLKHNPRFVVLLTKQVLGTRFGLTTAKQGAEPID